MNAKFPGKCRKCMHNNRDSCRHPLLSGWVLFVICWLSGLSTSPQFRTRAVTYVPLARSAEGFSQGSQTIFLYYNLYKWKELYSNLYRSVRKKMDEAGRGVAFLSGLK
jgi:hypothetical protein